MTQPDPLPTPTSLGDSSYSAPPASAIAYAAPKWFGLFVGAGLWVCAVRAFFGCGGLVTFIMLLTVLPVIVIYALVLASTVQRRCTDRGHVVPPWTTRVLVASLVGFAIAGLTIIDGSNLPGSTRSMFTAALHADVNGPVGIASSWISGVSFLLGLVGMVVGLVLVFVEKPRSPVTVTAA